MNRNNIFCPEGFNFLNGYLLNISFISIQSIKYNKTERWKSK